MSDYGRATQAQDMGPLFAKREGMARAESRDPDLAEVLREHARGVSNRLGRVTIDDCRDFADANGLVAPSTAFWGVIFKQPGWERLGFEPSRRVEKHGHVQSVWRWKGVA